MGAGSTGWARERARVDWSDCNDSSHEMRFARGAADRVVFIDEGLVVEAAPPQQIFDQPLQERTRRLLSHLHL